MGLFFIGEVEKFVIDDVAIYEVYFALASNPNQPECVEIYTSWGKKGQEFWRQRMVDIKTSPADPVLIIRIGEQIKIQEDIELR